MIKNTLDLLVLKSTEIILPFGIFLAVFVCGYVLRKILFERLSRWADKTTTNVDNIIITSVKAPFLIWCVMLAMYLALDISEVPQDIVVIVGRILSILGIFSVSIVVANIASKSIKHNASKIDSAFPVTSLTENISRIIIFGLGILIILNTLGISITPILATLGVGGLAVALALQDTLANFFAGFHIIVAKQIRIGDYIKLDSGEEGYVADINWRTTKIKMLPNNTVLVPNDKLTKAIIINYYLPDRELAVLVNLGVHYDSDLKKVEKITVEVAKETMREVLGGIVTFDPFIRYHTFADFSINFTVILRAKEFVDQYLIKHEFIKRLHERYAKEGIVVPYPIRAINYAQEGIERSNSK